MAGAGRLLFFISMLFLQLNAVESLTNFEKTFVRKLHPLTVNPGCDQAWCKNTSSGYGILAHTLARGEKDELHHLFSSIGAPTLMISRTPLNTELRVDYEILRQPDGMQAVNYSKIAKHSFGIIFSALYEYDDYNDTANMTTYKTNTSNAHRHELSFLNWMVEPKQGGDSTFQSIIVNATAPTDSNRSHPLDEPNSYLSFTIRYDSKDGRLVSRPHMEHTANSSMVTVEMANLKTSYPNSRFAVEMIMFSTEDHKVHPVDEQNATQMSLDRSLDDEYSPGVFQMRNWLANASKPREDAWGYAQWKPVVYTKRERLNADLSTASSYPNLNQNRSYLLDNIFPKHSLVDAYFGGDHRDISLNATNVSFGITNDKFYKNTKYLVWTMGMGMGPAPEDDVSTLVILVIAIGLGIPLLLMILSTVFVCVKNIRKRSLTTYTAIND